MAEAVVHRVSLVPISIPLHREIIDGAIERHSAESVVAVVELTGGIPGFGEAPGCTVPEAFPDFESTLLPVLSAFHPPTFPEALESISVLPWPERGNPAGMAGRAAIEQALLDAVMKRFRRGMSDLAAWIGLPGLGAPGSRDSARYLAPLLEANIQDLRRSMRRAYWRGMRAYKFDLSGPQALDRLKVIAGYLTRPWTVGKIEMHFDAAGDWLNGQAAQWLTSRPELTIASIEQPLPRGDEDKLSASFELQSVVLDESVVTHEDARRFADSGFPGAFNLGPSKCGGIIPLLNIAGLAKRAGIRLHLGGQPLGTSLSSAAELGILQVIPGVHRAEGCSGPRLLSANVTSRNLAYGWAGRPPRPDSDGLEVEVDVDLLNRLTSIEPRNFQL